MEPSLSHVGAFWIHFGASWDLFGASWGHFGLLGAVLGPSRSHLEAFWAILGPFGAVFRLSQGHLRASWGRLGLLSAACFLRLASCCVLLFRVASVASVAPHNDDSPTPACQRTEHRVFRIGGTGRRPLQ